MSKTTDTKAEQSYHFFGSTGLNWACAATREEVLAKLARLAGADTIKANTKSHGGLYAWTTRVELPQAADYGIQNFMPVNVPCSESRQHRITGLHTSSELVPDTVPLEECVLHDPYGKGTRPAAAPSAANSVKIASHSSIYKDIDGDWVLFCPNINDAMNAGRTEADVISSIVGVEEADD